MQSAQCPTEQALRSFTTGKMPLDEVDSVAEHLETCSECNSKLDQIEKSASDAVIEDIKESKNLIGHSTASDSSNTFSERYIDRKLIAQGGMGRVWSVLDQAAERRVALKEIRPERSFDQATRARFQREARTAAFLEHPGIVPIYDMQLDGAEPFYTMRLVSGRTLQDAISEHSDRKNVTSAQLRRIIAALQSAANAVAYAHANGVVHRDLKGDNILLGEFGEVLVVDWGLAKQIGAKAFPNDNEVRSPVSNETLYGMTLGTPEYMPPEQYENRVSDIDARSDVYALGVILYESLCGCRPVSGETPEKVLAKITLNEIRWPKPSRKCPAALQAIARKALSVEKQDRFKDAGEFADELQLWLDDEPVGCFREPVLATAGRWIRKHQTVSVSFAVMIAVAVVSLFIGNSFLRTKNATIKVKEQLAQDSLEQARSTLRQFGLTVANNPRLNQSDFQDLRRELLESTLPVYQEFVSSQSTDLETAMEQITAMRDLSRIYRSLGQPNNEQKILLTAAEKTDALLGSREETSQVQFESARIRYLLSDSLYQRGQIEDAKQELREAKKRILALLEQDTAERHVWLHADIVHLQGVIAMYEQRDEQSVEFIEEAIKIFKPVWDAKPNDPDRRGKHSTILIDLARILRFVKRDEDCKTRTLEAIAIKEKLAEEFPNHHLRQRSLMITYNNFGVFFKTIQSMEEASEWFDKSYQLGLRILDRFPTYIGSSLDLQMVKLNLGNVARIEGAQTEAISHYGEALKYAEKIFVREPDLLDALSFARNTYEGRGESYIALGEYENALADWNQAIKIHEGHEMVGIQFDLRLPLRKAFCLAHLGREQEAIEIVNTVMSEFADDAEANYQAAAVFAALTLSASNDEFRVGFEARTKEYLTIAIDKKQIGTGVKQTYLFQDPDFSHLSRLDWFSVLSESVRAKVESDSAADDE